METNDKLIERLIALAFAEDIGDGDHTTLSTIPASRLRICGDTLSIPEEAFLVSDAVIRRLLLA